MNVHRTFNESIPYHTIPQVTLGISPYTSVVRCKKSVHQCHWTGFDVQCVSCFRVPCERALSFDSGSSTGIIFQGPLRHLFHEGSMSTNSEKQ